MSTGAILEIEELCGGLTTKQQQELGGLRAEHVDLVLELCRKSGQAGVIRGGRAYHAVATATTPKPESGKWVVGWWKRAMSDTGFAITQWTGDEWLLDDGGHAAEAPSTWWSLPEVP